MKKLILPFLVFALVSFTTSNVKLTDFEREKAVKEMTKTHDLLLDAVAGLSDEQLNFKSSPDSWSIAECVEHIAISENNIFGMQQGTLKTPADPSKRDQVKMTDDQILEMIVDRSTKFKTQEPFEPTGKYGTYAATLDEFKNRRIENIDYVVNTDDDLRNHYMELPFGVLDAYQGLLFMSAHTERHVRQIEEIMSDENFPEE
ncbi:DinB family protein [Ulvibacter sp. MAR_2010_11]|uniref:DinB family protein n=1 Tax=Ulvibacter sp. MAR_2010_11 TaxID=1250229 RepID=UPI000C2C3D5A|nr:DinB family protein [Ulvibacter sp. MAR_2010_11]PKA84562.1 DinB family protein [Ulvibacter sp. MAR_2010_11]